MTDDSSDRMKCICCNQEKEALISVELQRDSIFAYRRGVCQDCIKNKDINNFCTEFEIRKTEEKISDFKEALKDMEKHLVKLRGS